LTFEEEARLSTQQISLGVQQAREAMNAPPTDLLAFEKALKQKHDSLKAAGLTPVLQPDSQAPRPKFKVAIAKVAKKNK